MNPTANTVVLDLAPLSLHLLDLHVMTVTIGGQKRCVCRKGA